MKGYLNILVIVVLLIMGIALSIGAYRYMKSNRTGFSNTLKSTAREKYLSRKYAEAYESYRTLVDSLKNQEEPVLINYANAGFLAVDALSNQFKTEAGPDQVTGLDSTLLEIEALSRDKYVMLSGGRNKTIRGMASNQLGYSLIRGKNVFESSNPDSILFEALEHFKEALRSDPTNDSARYNYELMKKVIDYPETVLSETKALVAQKRYKAAATLLAHGMQRDPRLRKQTEFMQRLRTVIGIDSLKTRSI